MLDFLIEDNKLMPIFKHEANFDERDILFVKELIAGELQLVLSWHPQPASFWYIFVLFNQQCNFTTNLCENWSTFI